MAGPGIRMWEMAKALSKEHSVTLLIPAETDLSQTLFEIRRADSQSVRTLADTHDVVIGQGHVLTTYPFLMKHPITKVVDLYDPSPVGSLEEGFSGSIENQMILHHSLVREHYAYLRAGDAFLCANERQWNFWVGMLMGAGRINPAIYRDDRMANRLLLRVPFGVPSSRPSHKKQVLKGVGGGIRSDDFVVLWGGGLWDWFDPMTAVEAMAMVAKRRQDIKLFFMGIKRPNGSVTSSQTVTCTLALAERLGLRDSVVFFNEWAPYEDRENYLLEADLGLNVHRNNLETAFSFRTRLMDYIWAGLPILTTEGDSLSDMVRERQLGRTVPCGDPDALAQAILQIADDSTLRQCWRENCLASAHSFQWERVFAPLIEWCRVPRPAEDKTLAALWDSHFNVPSPPTASISYYLRRAWDYYDRYGVAALLSKILQWWRRQ